VLNELEELEDEGFHVQTALSSTQPVFTSFTPCHQIPIIDGSEHPKSGERLADCWNTDVCAVGTKGSRRKEVKSTTVPGKIDINLP